MQKNTVGIIALFALVIGFGVGYTVNGTEIRTHVMPNGSMMSNVMMDMNGALTGKTGDAFDQAFISEMIVHHQGAVEMAQLALAHAKHQEIKDLATAIISAQNKEIGDMKSWQKNWYNQ